MEATLRDRGAEKEDNQVKWDRDRNAVRSLWFGNVPTESTAKSSYCAEELLRGPELLNSANDEAIIQAGKAGTQIPLRLQ